MSDNDLISRRALYEKTAGWEAQALHMVELHLHDEDKAEWRKWSTVLAERLAFKYDVAAAPAVNAKPVVRGEWICVDDDKNIWQCTHCGEEFIIEAGTPSDNEWWFCAHCGADMRREANDERRQS